VKAEGCLYSAYEILKTIRSQAGGINFDLYLDEMAQSKDSFRKLIQNERRLEFTFENHRYFDMRRWVLPLNEEVEGFHCRVAPSLIGSFGKVKKNFRFS